MASALALADDVGTTPMTSPVTVPQFRTTIQPLSDLYLAATSGDITTSAVSYTYLPMTIVTSNAGATQIFNSDITDVTWEVAFTPTSNYFATGSGTSNYFIRSIDGMLTNNGSLRIVQTGEYTVVTDSSDYLFAARPMSRAEMLRARIRDNMRGAAGIQSRHLTIVRDGPEAKARGLLKEMVGDAQFRNYMRKGFVVVRGASGIIYRVSQSGITSYARTVAGGYKKFENICVVFKEALPPTDAVAMRVLLLRYDEFATRAKANVSRYAPGDGSEFNLGTAGERLAKYARPGAIIGDYTYANQVVIGTNGAAARLIA